MFEEIQIDTEFVCKFLHQCLVEVVKTLTSLVPARLENHTEINKKLTYIARSYFLSFELSALTNKLEISSNISK